MDQASYNAWLATFNGFTNPVAGTTPDPRIQSGIPLPASDPADQGWSTDSSGLPDPDPLIEPVPEVGIDECEEGLNQKQMACIRLLVEGITITHAAERIGVTRRTAFMWHKKPNFLRVLRHYNKEATHASVNKMRQATKKITDELIRMATDKFVEPKDRLRAASIVLTTIQEQDAIEEVSDRITELEDQKLRPESGLYRIVPAKGIDDE